MKYKTLNILLIAIITLITGVSAYNIHYQDFTGKAPIMRCCNAVYECVETVNGNYTINPDMSVCYEISGSEKIDPVDVIFNNLPLISFLLCVAIVVGYIVLK